MKLDEREKLREQAKAAIKKLQKDDLQAWLSLRRVAVDSLRENNPGIEEIGSSDLYCEVIELIMSGSVQIPGWSLAEAKGDLI